MKSILIVAICVSLIAIFMRSQRRAIAADSKSGNPSDAADMGRRLRMMMLTNDPATLGTKPSTKFPRIYGVLMDFPIGKEIATVFSASDGAASLYTTSTFGVIGGEGHKNVREAAMKFVETTDRYFDHSTKTTEFPYPAAGRIRFYFLTFEGVRLIDRDFATVTSRKDECSELFNLGQNVLTELRLVTEKQGLPKK